MEDRERFSTGAICCRCKKIPSKDPMYRCPNLIHRYCEPCYKFLTGEYDGDATNGAVCLVCNREGPFDVCLDSIDEILEQEWERNKPKPVREITKNEIVAAALQVLTANLSEEFKHLGRNKKPEVDLDRLERKPGISDIASRVPPPKISPRGIPKGPLRPTTPPRIDPFQVLRDPFINNHTLVSPENSLFNIPKQAGDGDTKEGGKRDIGIPQDEEEEQPGPSGAQEPEQPKPIEETDEVFNDDPEDANIPDVMRCPDMFCRKLVSASAYEEHLNTKHKQTPKFGVDRGERLYIPFKESYFIEHNRTICIALISTLEEVNVPAFAGTKFEKMHELETFYLMVTGSPNKEEPMRTMFWVFIPKEDKNYKCTIKVSSRYGAVSESTQCDVHNSYKNLRFDDIATPGRGLIISERRMKRLLKQGKRLRVTVTVH